MKKQNPAVNQNISSISNSENLRIIQAKIREVWGNLDDEDFELYPDNSMKFFKKIQEKHNVSEFDARKFVQALERPRSAFPRNRNNIFESAE